jgi:hypothetical protein
MEIENFALKMDNLQSIIYIHSKPFIYPKQYLSQIFLKPSTNLQHNQLK